MSAPPENALPPPVMTIASHAGVGVRAVDAGDDVAARVVPEPVDRRVVERDDGHAAVQFVAGSR